MKQFSMNQIMIAVGILYAIITTIFLVDIGRGNRALEKKYEKEIDKLKMEVGFSQERLRVSDSTYYEEMNRMQDEIFDLMEKQAKSKEEVVRLDSLRNAEVVHREELKESLLNW